MLFVNIKYRKLLRGIVYHIIHLKLIFLPSSIYQFTNNVHIMTVFLDRVNMQFQKEMKHIPHWMELFALVVLDCFVIIKCDNSKSKEYNPKPFTNQRQNGLSMNNKH